MLISTEDAIDQVMRLERTIGFPKGQTEPLNRLVDSLIEACQRHHADPKMVVDRLRETSKYCPTDADLFSVAKQVSVAEYESVFDRRSIAALRERFVSAGHDDLVAELDAIWGRA